MVCGAEGSQGVTETEHHEFAVRAENIPCDVQVHSSQKLGQGTSSYSLHRAFMVITLPGALQIVLSSVTLVVRNARSQCNPRVLQDDILPELPIVTASADQFRCIKLKVTCAAWIGEVSQSLELLWYKTRSIITFLYCTRSLLGRPSSQTPGYKKYGTLPSGLNGL